MASLRGRAARLGVAALERAAGALLVPVLWFESRWPSHGARNERPVEYAFALSRLRDLAPLSVLDVGPGRSAWPQALTDCGFRVTAIDRGEGYWTSALINRHHRVLQDDVARPRVQGPFDAITCLSVLEHVDDPDAAVRGLVSLLRPGGHLVLTCPWSESRRVENAYALPGASYGKDYAFICRQYARADMDRWLAATGARLVDEELWEAFSGEWWAHGDRLQPPRRSDAAGRHHLGCFLLRAP